MQKKTVMSLCATRKLRAVPPGGVSLPKTLHTPSRCRPGVILASLGRTGGTQRRIDPVGTGKVLASHLEVLKALPGTASLSLGLQRAYGTELPHRWPKRPKQNTAGNTRPSCPLMSIEAQPRRGHVRTSGDMSGLHGSRLRAAPQLPKLNVVGSSPIGRSMLSPAPCAT